jgi:hypothetical protein
MDGELNTSMERQALVYSKPTVSDLPLGLSTYVILYGNIT